MLKIRTAPSGLLKKAYRFATAGRRRLPEFRKGKHPSSEFKKGNTVWVGRHHAEGSKRKISLTRAGRRQSTETRAKNPGLTWEDSLEQGIDQGNDSKFSEDWRGHAEPMDSREAAIAKREKSRSGKNGR
jgi:hypothetical protein